MSKKRYVLVRVDDTPICPRNYEDVLCHYLIYHNYDKCEKCIKQYGDTKDQLTNKMAQVLLKDYLKSFKGAKIDKASIKKFWLMQKKLAIELFDFMWKEKDK